MGIKLDLHVDLMAFISANFFNWKIFVGSLPLPVSYHYELNAEVLDTFM